MFVIKSYSTAAAPDWLMINRKRLAFDLNIYILPPHCPPHKLSQTVVGVLIFGNLFIC